MNGQKPAARVLIVDGHALAYKMFHALPEMTSPAGAPTNAIFGFIKSLRRTLEELQPTHGVVVWDGGLSTERLALLPEYKAQRAPMPDSLRSQLSPLQQWVCLAGWECIRQDATEADDIIGTLALEAERSGAEVLILSPDKDFMQIVSERVHLLRARGGGLERYTPGLVREKIGVAPEQIVDWLSLVGDASDHIEGVPGVGAKTAAKLLEEFGSLSALFERVECVQPERLRKLLETHKALLERNRELITLTRLPQWELSLERLVFRQTDRAAEEKFLGDWGLKSLQHKQQDPLFKQAELF